MKNQGEIEERLGITFQNKDLLEQALTHKSWLYQHPFAKFNERLEYLGDAILEFLVSEYLFNHFPEKEEGELTLLRANLTRSETLSKTAEQLGLSEFVKRTGEFDEKGLSSIIADVIEALIGAIYLDQGLAKARDFVLKFIIKPNLQQAQKILKDPKTYLQELTQKHFGSLPKYKVVKEAGPDHRKEFFVEVEINNNKKAFGHGRSKQEAESEAAQKAILKYFKNNENH